MSLNNKNDDAHRLARELAAITGESLAMAVTRAVRERLDRAKHDRLAPLAERLLAIGRDCAARLPDAVLAADHGELLHGDDGAPH